MSAATGGFGRMVSLELLSAERYTGIEDRVGDVERVRKELQVVIDALPTQIHPDERTLYLNAILYDLEDREDAAWPQWPEDVYVLALTCIRYLGRNPVGSTTLLTPAHLSTIIHHTSLPFPPPASPFSHPSPSPASPPAIESLRIMANLLVLHPSGRNAFAKAGGVKAMSLALAGKDSQGVLLEGDTNVLDGPDRVFLLARLAFLGTVDRPDAVGPMVDTGGIVESLSYHLTRLAPTDANQMAIGELLKVVMNVLQYYKAKPSGSGSEEWSEKLDPLLAPILNLFHSIPTPTLAPPLSTTLHALFSIPFLPRLLPTWHAIPEPPSPASSTSSVRSLINKISNLSSSGSNKRNSLMASRSNSSLNAEDTGLGLSGSGLGPPTSQSHGRVRTLSGRSTSGPPSPADNTRQAKAPATIMDTSAFPLKVLKALEGWFDAYIPYPEVPDEIDEKIMVDEVLPPVLLLLAAAAAGSPEFRKVFKEQLLPQELDRSVAAGPLEKRRGMLGYILRLMHSSTHFATRNSAGEFLWSVCESDATTLTAEIGYGNAAGFLFQKGITAPPSGKIQDIPDSSSSSSNPSPTPSTPLSEPSQRHPISGLSEPLPSSADVPMTPDEKLREAERLFVLFERMEKNPVIRLTPEDPAHPGPGRGKGVKEMMAQKLASGEMEAQDAADEAEEMVEQERRDKRDEAEVERDMERYRIRMRKLERREKGPGVMKKAAPAAAETKGDAEVQERVEGGPETIAAAEAGEPKQP